MVENSAASATVTRDARRRANGARRQARHRARQSDAGFAEVVIVVPRAAAADLRLNAEAMRAFPHLRPGAKAALTDMRRRGAGRP